EQKIEPYKPLLLNLKKILKNSNSSFQKDEAVIELLIEVIKQDFPEQPYPQYLEEIKKKHIKLREINEEIRRLKDESQNQ
ncbi:hypothetical protein, partial [Klebsiella pneumoniae]|uniref:hypothetical protein n=1 Tax=Klebsiella pneumoniae TaxID=573 RepID=UPI0025A0DAEE